MESNHGVSTPGPHRIGNRVPQGRVKFIPKRIHQRLFSLPFSFPQGQALRDADRVWPAYPALKRRAIATRP